MNTVASVQIGVVLTEFLEALVHQVLFLRQVYDPELFERHRLYSIAVRKASHPGVVEYIQKLTHSLKAGLESGALRRVIIVILDRVSQAVEKYVLELKLLQPERLRQMSPIELEAALRSVLLKMQFMDACLRPLPQDCTFTVLACAEGEAVMPVDLWVEASAEGAEAAASQAPVEPAAPASYTITAPHELVPIKTTSVSRALHLQFYVDTSLSLSQ